MVLKELPQRSRPLLHPARTVNLSARGSAHPQHPSRATGAERFSLMDKITGHECANDQCEIYKGKGKCIYDRTVSKRDKMKVKCASTLLCLRCCCFLTEKDPHVSLFISGSINHFVFVVYKYSFSSIPLQIDEQDVDTEIKALYTAHLFILCVLI